MSRREAISRYSLIVNKVSKGPCTLQEIKDYLETQSEIQGYNYNISTRTFQRDLEDIREIMKVDIQYNAAKKSYEIVDSHVEHINERMLEAFEIFHALQLSDGMSRYIHFENRKPKGTEHLYLLLHAVKNRQMLRFVYQKFDDEESSSRFVEPYALKEFKQRWYLLAKEQNDERVKLFALDRIEEAEVTKKKFIYPKDFDVATYFKYTFGIVHQDGAPEQPVVLSFTPMQGKYIKSLPLHHSQMVLVDDSKEYRIQLQVHPTYDLLMELLSHGSEVQVLAPENLTAQLRALHQAAIVS